MVKTRSGDLQMEGPCCAIHLVIGWVPHPTGKVPPLHAPNELLALAAANRFLDAPQWQLLEDKCSLHGLLQVWDGEVSRTPNGNNKAPQ